MEAFFGFNLFENFTGTCPRELPSEFTLLLVQRKGRRTVFA